MCSSDLKSAAMACGHVDHELIDPDHPGRCDHVHEVRRAEADLKVVAPPLYGRRSYHGNDMPWRRMAANPESEELGCNRRFQALHSEPKLTTSVVDKVLAPVLRRWRRNHGRQRRRLLGMSMAFLTVGPSQLYCHPPA